MFQRSVALTANQNTRDLLSQVLGYPFTASRPMALVGGVVASAAQFVFGFEVNVGGGNVVSYVNEMQPSTANRFPINPDDFTVGPIPLMPGQQLLMPVRETAGATPTVFITLVPKFA